MLLKQCLNSCYSQCSVPGGAAASIAITVEIIARSLCFFLNSNLIFFEPQYGQ